MIKIGNVDLSNITVGTTQITRVMYASEIVWENLKWIMDWEDITDHIATDYDEEVVLPGITSVVQAKGIADMSSTHNAFEAKYELVTIDSGTSAADTLYTNSTLKDGDNLVIVKDDGSIHEVIASGVGIAENTPLESFYKFNHNLVDSINGRDGIEVNTVTYDDFGGEVFAYASGAEDGVASFPYTWSDKDGLTSIKALSFKTYLKQDEGTGFGHPNSDGFTNRIYINVYYNSDLQTVDVYLQWRLESLSGDYNYYIARSSDTYSEGDTPVIYIERLENERNDRIYIDGVEVTTFIPIGTQSFGQKTSYGPFVFGKITSNGDVATGRSGYIKDLRFFNRSLTEYEIINVDSISTLSMDTSAITQGEVPSRVFAVDCKPSFDFGDGFIDVVEDNSTYEYLDILNSADPFGDGSLHAKFQFDGNGDDLLGGYTAIPYSALFRTEGGKFGGYLDAPTTSTYATIPNLGAWFAGRTDFSVSFFAKPSTSYAGVYHMIHIGYTSHEDPYYAFSVSFTPTGIDSVINFVRTSYSFQQEIDANNFYHICVTFNNGTLSIYFDGILVLIDQMPSPLAVTNPTAALGRLINVNSTSNACNVRIDQLEIYYRELNIDEIMKLYAPLYFKKHTKYEDLISPTPSTAITPKVLLKNIGDSLTEIRGSIIS